MLSRARAAVARWFFANFFYFLFLAVCAAQWVVLTWLMPPAWVWQWQIHPLGFATLYLGNRWMIRGSSRFALKANPSNLAVRAYYGTAIASVFAAAYLGGLIVLWVAATHLTAAAQAAVPAGEIALLTDQDRFFRFLGNFGIALIGLVFAYGYSVGQARLIVTRRDLRLRHLPPALDGLRVLQLSDIHIGQNLDREQLARFVARANAERPDLICITGDVIDSARADMDAFLPILAELRARHGVIMILGNHDHYAGPERVIETVGRHTDFIVLRDQSTSLTIDGARLHVVGLDDRGIDWARGVPETPELDALFAALPAGEPVLLLSHRPDIFQQAARLGIGLTLSGHTHGGQLGLPWWKGRVLNPSMFMTAFDRGLFERNGSYLYVNNGLGVTLQRLRLSTPREISLFDLRSGGDACA